MRCIDCKFHKAFPTTNIHWCEATKKHKRISDEDAYVDAPCKVADRKTENSSEKPNNSTISKMEQVDKDINVRSKDEPQTCSVNGRPYDCGKCEYFRCTADEPQTEVVMPYERMRGLYTGYRKTEQTERRK